MPLAAAVGALLDHQHVEAPVQADVRPAAEVPGGRAPVAVAQNGERRPVRRVVIAPGKPEPVV